MTCNINSSLALSHIHVSAAYRSRIYENFDTPRSEAYFVRATYVPHTCDVPATFPWRISDVSIFVWNFTFVCTVYVLRTCDVCMAYTRDVSTTHVLRTILICGVSVLYQLLLCSLCSCNSHITVINIRGRRCHRRNLNNLDYFTPKKKTEVGDISKLPILVVRRYEQRPGLHQA